MNLTDCMSILGLNPGTYYRAIEHASMTERVKLAQEMLLRAKSQSKNLLSKNHPDQGGDAQKFKLINRAYSEFREQTEQFIEKLKDRIEEARKVSDSRILITTK
jgi:hypothetical protein